MRAIALLALTGCTQIFGLTDPVSRMPADAAPDIDGSTDVLGPDAAPPGACNPDLTALIACFDFEGSVVDKSSSGQVVTAITNASFSGTGGPAGMFVQVGSASTITVAASTTFNTSQYTMAAWVRLEALPGSGARMGVFDADARYGLFIDANGSMVVRNAASPVNAIGVGTWTHLAVTDNGTTITFYKNGVALGASPASTPVPTSNAGAEIGGNAPTGDRLEGAIDSLHIYTRILSAAEITTLYTN